MKTLLVLAMRLVTSIAKLLAPGAPGVAILNRLDQRVEGAETVWAASEMRRLIPANRF